MKRYYVHTEKDAQGQYEVHTEDCSWLPEPEKREYLGNYSNGNEAVRIAKCRGYASADGCWHCCREAHKG